MKFIDCTDLIEPIEFTIKLYDERDKHDEHDERDTLVELMYQTNSTSLLVTIQGKTFVYTDEPERSIWSTMLMQWHDVLIVPWNCENYSLDNSSYGTPPSLRVMKDLDMLRTLYPSKCYIIARLNDIVVDDGMYVSTIKTGLTWLAWCVKYMLRYNQEISPLLNAMPMMELIKLVYRCIQGEQCVQGEMKSMDNVSAAIRNCLTSNARSIYRILLGDQFYDERKKYVIYGWIMKDRYILERPNTELFDPSRLGRQFIGPLDLPIKFVSHENQDIPARLISIIQHGLILSDLLDKENEEHEENNSTSLIIHHIMWNLLDKVNIKDLERRMNNADN